MFIYLLLFYLFLLILILLLFLMLFFYYKLEIFFEFLLLTYLSMKLELLFYMDWVALLFILVVILISSMVLMYSLGYMAGSLKIEQFLMLVLMFVLSMVLMISSPNLVSILLGWDGLGLVSYCLVIFYQSKSSFNSGMVTVLTNRLGDIMILLSVSLLISLGSWNYMFFGNLEYLIYYLLFVAAITKSAQVPFSSWLPLAMAAPTPVSSLVHSSTLVTAGVYLLIRLNYLLEEGGLSKLVMIIAVVTMFMAGLGASFEFDFKKIIALSTLSQLGVMIFCLSLKLSEMALFHLLTHALFKSMLFMCAGVIIHSMLSNQDIRFISMTLVNMPLISVMFNCSTLSLCGIPFMSGFFSKDLILEMYMMNLFNKFIFIMLFISMGLTVMYSSRLVYFSFVKTPQLSIYMKDGGASSVMGVSMYMLFILSVVGGSLMSWLIFSMKSMIFLTLGMKTVIYLFMGLGVVLGKGLMMIFPYFMYFCNFNKFIKFFSMLWFLPFLYGSWIPVKLKFTHELIFYVEMGWLEYVTSGVIKKIVKELLFVEGVKNFFYMVIYFLFFIVILMW